MKKSLSLLIVLAMLFSLAGPFGSIDATAASARYMEYLDRGLVAMKTNKGIYLSWRLLGTEAYNSSFDVYRNGEKIATVSTSTNYIDTQGAMEDEYYVVGNSNTSSTVKAFTSQSNYFDIPLSQPPAAKLPDGSYVEYTPWDATTGDLDGDGVYEIIQRWDAPRIHAGQEGDTGGLILDAYKLDGTVLWRINLGVNVRCNTENIFTVYDYNSDGVSEIIVKTAPGSKDGTGRYVTEASQNSAIRNADNSVDYRSSSWATILQGDEYYTLFDGRNGKALDTIYYPFPRGEGDDFYIWGDNYGHRSDKFLDVVAYLDGVNPHIVTWRGIYHGQSAYGPGRTAVAAYKIVNNRFQFVADFDTQVDGTQYKGQGNHNITVGDVDEDGKDEIISGGLCLDNDLSVLWCTGRGHGDALHLGNYDPTTEGLEYMCVHEESPYGMSVINAKTGKDLLHKDGTGDTGRGIMANVGSGGYYQVWGAGTYQSNGGTNFSETPLSGQGYNFRIFWDGDTYDELLDAANSSTNYTPVVSDYNASTGSMQTLFTAWDSETINNTKATVAMTADILGDWREEIVAIRQDKKAIRVFVSDIYTENKLYTLMHDSQYRQQVVSEHEYYNQPPHIGFYLSGNNDSYDERDVKPNINVVKYAGGTFDGATYIAPGVLDEVKKPDSRYLIDMDGDYYPAHYVLGWLGGSGELLNTKYTVSGRNGGNGYVASGNVRQSGVMRSWGLEPKDGKFLVVASNTVWSGSSSPYNANFNLSSKGAVYDKGKLHLDFAFLKNYSSDGTKDRGTNTAYIRLGNEVVFYYDPTALTLSLNGTVIHTFASLDDAQKWSELDCDIDITNGTFDIDIAFGDGGSYSSIVNVTAGIPYNTINAEAHDGWGCILLDNITLEAEGIDDSYIYSTAGFEATDHGPMTNGVIEMDLIPFVVGDNVVGITSSTSSPAAYGDFNIIVRFTPDGIMDAYNGSGYSSYESVPYEAGKKYHLYIETKVANKTYSAWVTDEEGNTYTLAQNYAYRASAPSATDLGKLTLIGGAGVGGSKFAAANVQFYNSIKKTVTYIFTDENSKEVDRWVDGPRAFETGSYAYNFPQGEVYGIINNKAYIVKSNSEQVYIVADDNNDEHTVTVQIVHENAVKADTFADVDGANNDESSDMLFIGSSGVTNLPETNADGTSVVYNKYDHSVLNPRLPLLTFDVPENYEKGKAVTLNIYVAQANQNLANGKYRTNMLLAANCVDVAVNENTGYKVASYVSQVPTDYVWSNENIEQVGGSATDGKIEINKWLTIDVTEYVQNADGDTVTFALYAPLAGAYVVDRESASPGGSFMGKAAYLSVADGESITTSGMEKVTKNGSVVQNKASFVVPVNSTVKFYAPSDSGAYAVTNGTDSYTLTDNVTASVNPVAGNYYLTYRSADAIYSTAGVNEGFVTTSHGPITNGVIDMDLTPILASGSLIAISSSTSNPTWYGQSNLQINFTAGGKIQAYNGSTGLMAETDISYTIGKKYHLHIETDVTEATYSAWITDENGNEYLLASDYVYRSSAAAADDLSKLLVIGDWNVEAGVLVAENVVFENAVTKTVTYTINDENGVYKTWSVGPKQFALDEVLYSFPQGEFYYEHDGKAYILKSDTEQSYTVANDSNDVHNVTLTLVHENAVLTDTFADSDANNNNASSDMLFVGSQGVSDAPDTDDKGNATVTGSGYNMGAPRVPVLTFNVPESYEEGDTVKLKVYVAKTHTHLGAGNSMKLAANVVNVTVNEEAGYSVDAVASLENLSWSENMFRLPSGSNPGVDMNTWVTIDVTEFVAGAAGDTVTFSLYAPRAAAYVVDRESASGGGSYMGKAAYLEVTKVEKIAKSVVYTIKDENTVYETWTETYEDYKTGDVLYDFPEGEFYYEHGGKAYVVKSESEQKYVVADDNLTAFNVEFTLAQGNAVLYDTFATIDGAENVNNTENLLFIGSAGVSDIADTDADNVSTVSDKCRNVGNPRIPLITFNMPVVEEGKAVKLNVYVAKANDTFFSGNNAVSMRIAAGVANMTVDENTNYDVDDYVDINNIIWSDNEVAHTGAVTWDASGQRGDIGQWITIDVTEYVQSATGDTITFTLYAPKAGLYIADREKTGVGGEYEGKAAYLEIVDANTVTVYGATKLTKMGNLVAGESVLVPVGATIKAYEESKDIVAFTDGEKVYGTGTTGETPYIEVTCDMELSGAMVGVYPVEGAQVRIGEGVDENGKVAEGSGLRFITIVDMTDSLAAIEGAQYGVEVVAEGSTEAVVIPARKWQKEGEVYTSALTNLAESNFNRKFTATPYIKVDNQTFYGESVTRSIYQVAAGLLVNESTDGTDYDEDVINSAALYKVLNAYVNQTGIRLSVTSSGLTEYTGTGQSAYSGEQFFEVISAETVGENVYTITIKPSGSKTVIASYWQDYIRINNNNSKIKSFTSLKENADGSVTITFDYAAFLNK